MSQNDGVAGRIPAGRDADEYDRLRRRVLWTMPSGLYVVGSRAEERRNAMTLNWATQVSMQPKKLLAIAVLKGALTHDLISEGSAFSLCILDREDRAVVRKFTKPVEVDVEQRTLNGFTYAEAVTGVPILTIATAWLDCRLHQSVDVGDHTLFLGEVVDAGFNKAEDTPILRMEDTRMNYGG